jgi:hypothetical protein
MSKHNTDELDDDAEPAPKQPGQLSSNAHWLFGSIYAALALIGFSFGVWAGAAKPKPVEVADAKQKENTETPVEKPKPVVNPTPTPTPDPKAKEPEPKAKEPEPKAKEPEPKPEEKEPEPKPKANEPEPKKVDVKPVAFKEVLPILRAHCNNCHGDVGKPKYGVDLRTVAAIMKGDKNGDPIVVPGNPEKSPLYESITSGRMPDEGKPAPSPEKMEILRNWILSGAKERRRVVRVRRDPRSRMSRRLELTGKPEAG